MSKQIPKKITRLIKASFKVLNKTWSQFLKKMAVLPSAQLWRQIWWNQTTDLYKNYTFRCSQTFCAEKKVWKSLANSEMQFFSATRNWPFFQQVSRTAEHACKKRFIQKRFGSACGAVKKVAEAEWLNIKKKSCSKSLSEKLMFKTKGCDSTDKHINFPENFTRRGPRKPFIRNCGP
jgi:hypothetical protein